jgi:outer membrane autotransporter protein
MWGNVRIRPSAEIVHFTETQKAYVNAIGIAIDEQTVHLGRAIIGPEISTQFTLSDGVILEPSLGLKAVWDFSKSDDVTAAGLPIEPDGLRGRIEAGVSLRFPSGVSVRASGAYDGIGISTYHAIQGRAQLIVPLQ